jgi:hypothetical protein
MTAITLNLLAEEQLAEQASARDPLKTAIAAGALIISFTALSGSVLWVYAGQKKTEAGRLQARWDTLAASEQGAGGEIFQSIKSMADDVVAINRSRMLWAPQLAVVKDIVPDSIQLLRLNFSVTTEAQQLGAAPSGEESASGKSKRPPAPKNTERVTLQLEGKAVSSRPEIEVDTFIQTLRSNPVFSEQVKQIQLRSIARAPIVNDRAEANVPAAQFVIDCLYKERN